MAHIYIAVRVVLSRDALAAGAEGGSGERVAAAGCRSVPAEGRTQLNISAYQQPGGGGLAWKLLLVFIRNFSSAFRQSLISALQLLKHRRRATG